MKTGTATISRHVPTDILELTSKARELGIATRKSMLLTSYSLHDGTVLHIANIHSLNFVTNTTWKNQLDYFMSYLPKSGALIFAGDFNTWNPGRFDYLEKVMRTHRLTYAHYNHNMIMRLDHIWTRDLEIIETVADLGMHSSDHYPITMKFTLIEKMHKH